MAQIIDMEERRKPRAAVGGMVEPPLGPLVLDPMAYADQLLLPMATMWRSWFASWGSLWLAPFGLQMSPVEPPRPDQPKDRAGPLG